MLKPAIKFFERFKAMPEADLGMICHGRVDAETGGLAIPATDKAQIVSWVMRSGPYWS